MHDFFAFIQKRMPQVLDEWEAERAAAGRATRAEPERPIAG
jgi:hypothetical protein